MLPSLMLFDYNSQLLPVVESFPFIYKTYKVRWKITLNSPPIMIISSLIALLIIDLIELIVI